MSILTLAAAALTFQPAVCDLPDVPPDFEKRHRIECGWVAVPRKPGGKKTLRLWTARVPSTNPAKQRDSILYINGGPGIATVDSVVPAIATSKTLQALLQDRDIIFFDQRGSGRSEETLCPELADTLKSISTAGLAPATEEEQNRAAFSDCRSQLEKAGIDLSAYSTTTTVADIEALRKAFKVEQWNVLSVSYGTLVAMHAMRTHPKTIRAAILSSPYPPNSVTWAEQASSAAAAYQAIDRACSADPACRERFGSVVPKLEATLARLERDPVKDGEKTITGRTFATALWPLAVQSSTVRYVPLAIERAHSGDEAFIRQLVAVFGGGDSFGDFSPAQGQAINCPESGRTREWYARARALYPALVSEAPDDTWDRLCAAFRPGHADPAFFAPVASDIPTLLYAGTLDPATPVIDAYQALRFLTNATLVEVAGASHAPVGVDDCTRGIALEFVRRPATAPDVACLARRVPTPFAVEGLDELLAPGS